MDVAYNHHSPYSRHNSRSHTNLNHLTLAPLTTRLPLSDPDALPESAYHVSYIEGRSAPTTPSILSRSSSRVSLRKPMNLSIPKSKSSTHLLASRKQPRSGPTTPGGTKLKKSITKDELYLSTLSAQDRNDSDWLLRAGAAISSSTRESKGQSWLVSRASSTSLTGQRDEDEEELERTLAREREHNSKRASRRGSAIGAFDADDEFSPVTTRRSLSFGPATGHGSRPVSGFGSRGNSRRGSRAQLFTPLIGERDGYFDQRDFPREEYITEPDFVDVDEEALNNEEEDDKNDEAVIKKLARASNIGLGGWVEKMLGWSLFAVDEDGEDETEMIDEKGEESEISSTSRKTLDGATDPLPGDVPPPLRDDEAGGWQDAAWLLSVATKVLL
ncbi:uncharacterized protein LY89DRAFT_219512 [Mollisia scopiformis]|uniref:Uncharacterized protein n=1 Tax=Mollisia scopiformis TaxID=149040 RepID=A0A194WWG5_MOLSC|nr:uncharacterized protein LY89DRAFT_219512 [Mollisia scopiformis]KUJ12019.1 hypothetical protein LY89DRAFT_219512 [Mollisia scopiformis]